MHIRKLLVIRGIAAVSATCGSLDSLVNVQDAGCNPASVQPTHSCYLARPFNPYGQASLSEPGCIGISEYGRYHSCMSFIEPFGKKQGGGMRGCFRCPDLFCAVVRSICSVTTEIEIQSSVSPPFLRKLRSDLPLPRHFLFARQLDSPRMCGWGLAKYPSPSTHDLFSNIWPRPF